MWFYYGIIIIMLICWAYSHQKQLTLSRKYEICGTEFSNHKSYIVFCSLLFVFLIGCRAETVGIDAWNYKMTYLRMNNASFQDLSTITWLSESGYTVLLIGLNKLGFSWNGYFILAAAIFVLPVMLLVFRESENVFFSVILFVMLGYFVFPMSTMRQSIAIGFCILAFFQLEKRQYLRYALLTFIASSFHVSALITFLLFIVSFIKPKKNNVYVWTGIAFFVVILGVSPLRNVFTMVLSSIGKDYQSVDTGGWLREIFFIVTILLSLYVNWNDNEFIDQHKFSYFSVLIAAVLLPIVKYHPALSRLYFYFSIQEIILIPSLIARLNNLKLKLLGGVCYFAGAAYMMLLQLPSKNVIPYLFFWNM